MPEIISTKKLETTTAIVKMVQQKYSLPKEEIITICFQIEEENKIHFNKKHQPYPQR